MKKIIFAICMICSGAAFAANEESVTSREYVDAGLSAKQDTLTTTGTGAMIFDSSETDGLGQKPVYNPDGDYASQQDALVTASTANAAVQNAIAAEFVCISWKNDDPNDECLLVQIRNRVNPTRNLFDVSQIPSYQNTINTTKLINNGDGSITVTDTIGNSGIGTMKKLSALAPGLVPGNTYTLSFKKTGCTGGSNLIHMGAPARTAWVNGVKKTITQDMLDSGVSFYACYNGVTPSTATIYDIQIEEGAVATPYVPYGNTYLPTGNQ
ncbi:MAG: hypothetical protein J6T57_04000 [Alphaproteobacteria bacterium]|nr:hypothetical protein [Alphaproteobacteria bacterium]